MVKNKYWSAMAAALAIAAIVPGAVAEPILDGRREGLPAVDGSLIGSPAPRAMNGGAEPAQSLPESPWLSRALFVELREGARWSPWAIVPLASGKESNGGLTEGSEPRFAIWHEGEMRRVEMGCSGSSWAWEQLAPGASAQLEFGCGNWRYRAQLGSFHGDAGLAKASPRRSSARAQLASTP